MIRCQFYSMMISSSAVPVLEKIIRNLKVEMP